MTVVNQLMPASPIPIDETDFLQFIEHGAGRLTPRQVHQLVSDLPDLRRDFGKMKRSRFPEASRQLEFLAALVEDVWTDRYRELSYGAALEAAFGLSYFARAEDLIPDSIGELGLLDDAAIVATVLIHNAPEYQAFAEATKRDWHRILPG